MTARTIAETIESTRAPGTTAEMIAGTTAGTIATSIATIAHLGGELLTIEGALTALGLQSLVEGPAALFDSARGIVKWENSILVAPGDSTLLLHYTVACAHPHQIFHEPTISPHLRERGKPFIFFIKVDSGFGLRDEQFSIQSHSFSLLHILLTLLLQLSLLLLH
jgi:hypothetical protein